jgi:hypothetical protein
MGHFYDGKCLAVRYFFNYKLSKTTAQFDLLDNEGRTTVDDHYQTSPSGGCVEASTSPSAAIEPAFELAVPDTFDDPFLDAEMAAWQGNPPT